MVTSSLFCSGCVTVKVFDVAQGLKVGLEPVDPDGGKLIHHSAAANTTLKVKDSELLHCFKLMLRDFSQKKLGQIN